jgi:AAA domain
MTDLARTLRMLTLNPDASQPARPLPPHLIRDKCATDIATKQIQWVWPGRLPNATVAILEGDPDGGKSTIASVLSAAFSVGATLPDSRDDALPAFSGPVNVGYVTAEDDPAVTLIPRFLTAGGDPRRLFFYEDVVTRGATDEGTAAELLSLPKHVAALADWIRRRDLKVVTIDVLSAFTDEQVDSHNDASVRRMLTPLAQLAAATGCLILIIRHLTKGRGAKAIYAGQGSIGYGAAARSVLTAACSPTEPDGFVLAVTKGNLAPREWRSTLAYSLTGAPYTFDDGTTGTAAKLEWGDTVDLSADEALAHPEPGEGRSALAEAKEWLADHLKAGDVGATEVEHAARRDGHSWATIRRAKDELGVRSVKVGDGWKWTAKPLKGKDDKALTSEDAQDAQAVIPEHVEHLAQLDYSEPPE